MELDCVIFALAPTTAPYYSPPMKTTLAILATFAQLTAAHAGSNNLPLPQALAPTTACASAEQTAKQALFTLVSDRPIHCIGQCSDNTGCQLGCSCGMSGWCQ